MFRKQSSTTKSISCGASADLANRFSISALASKAVALLSSLIGGVGAVFYLIFSWLMNQAQAQFNSSNSSTEMAKFNIINSDTYSEKLEESAPSLTENEVTVNQEDSLGQRNNQVKFVNKGLFFCALLFDKRKIALQKEEISKSVEKENMKKQKKQKYSSTENNILCFLGLFLISKEQFTIID